MGLEGAPGTDTCKLGIASSRGLARELRDRLQARTELDAAVLKLKIKIQEAKDDFPDEKPALARLPQTFRYNCHDCQYNSIRHT